MAEKEEFQMTLSAAEIDAALIAAQSAILHKPQTLPTEQQEQARANIGAGLPPVLIDLDTYGETPVSLILGDLFRQGGGARENVDIGNLMDALLTDNPLRVHFTFGVNVLYAYGVCVGRVNNKAVQLNLNAMFTYQGKTYVAYVSIDTPSADEAGKANISMSVEEPGELPEAPVQSVNGQTGAVHLSATDVGARPDDWMPTAQEVGALPNTYTPPNQTAEQVGADPKGTAASAVSQHNAADDSHNDIRRELKAINDRLTAFFDSDNQTLKASGEFDGDPGAPGVTPHIGENGNWYIGSNDTGVKAQGKDGAPGKTPAKGTDYFTAADKAEMVNAVIAALPVYKGEVL